MTRQPSLVTRRDIGRRQFLEMGATAFGSFALGPAVTGLFQHGKGRLSSRPGTPAEPRAPGRHALGLGGRRDGVLYIPAGHKPESPAPLVVMLHGAGGSAPGALWPFEALADERGFVLLAPESRAMSWDVRFGPFGPDVEFIDRALARVFRHCAIDPARMAVEGFSDGASYALSLGLTNGDLFRRVVAFSPGFVELADPAGKPPVFVSHGTRDTVLAIERTSRVIVPRLRRAGYQVEYKEFDGGHTVPREIAAEAAAWLAAE